MIPNPAFFRIPEAYAQLLDEPMGYNKIFSNHITPLLQNMAGVSVLCLIFHEIPV